MKLALKSIKIHLGCRLSFKNPRGVCETLRTQPHRYWNWCYKI